MVAVVVPVMECALYPLDQVQAVAAVREREPTDERGCVVVAVPVPAVTLA